jgi:amino acid transporter
MTPPEQEPQGLRRTLSTRKVVFLVVAAAAPLAAMVGTVPLAFAIGDGPGLPDMFVFAGVVLLCFSVGYAAMSRRIVNAGGFYTYLSCGIGRPPAVGGGLLAVISYNAASIGLLGAFGYFFQLVAAALGLNLPWEVWTALALVAVAVLGYRQIDLSARVLSVLMSAEILVLLVLDVAVVGHKGLSALPATSFDPHVVLSGAVGVAMMFAFTSFIGFESAALYGEETKNPTRSVPIATYVSVVLISVFYALTSWIAVGAIGPSQVVSVASRQLGNLFFTISDQYAANLLTVVMQVLLCTSLFAAVLALHNATNRYTYVLGRERVLPNWLGRAHARHGSPHRASLVQTGLNVLVITAFALAGLDPYLNLATAMLGLGTLGIVILQFGAAVSVLGFFRKRSDGHWWKTFTAPLIGALGLATAAVLLVTNFGVLTGTTNPIVRALPWLLLAAALGGVGYGLWLKTARPQRYAELAGVQFREQPQPQPVEDPSVAGV